LSCSVQRYAEEIVDVDRYRPDHCPQCEARDPLTGHGFYCRTLMRAGKRKGFGWKRWSRQWLYGKLGLFNGYRRRRPEPKVQLAR
jgi:hypothetical protein